jgi:hypothetical protein
MPPVELNLVAREYIPHWDIAAGSGEHTWLVWIYPVLRGKAVHIRQPSAEDS